MTEKNYTDALKTALDGIRDMVDAETIIGEPISTEQGTVIIPVSKVMIGLATGGMDYVGKHSKKETDKANSFSGYGGSGVTVSPVAFLVIKPDGEVSLLNVNNPMNSTNDLGSSVLSILNKTPSIIDKVKDLVKGSKKSTVETMPEPEEIDLSKSEQAE